MKKKSLPPSRPAGVALGGVGGGCKNKKGKIQNNTATNLKFCMYNPVLCVFQKIKNKSLPPSRPSGMALGGWGWLGSVRIKKVNSQNNTAIDLKFCMYNPVLPLFQKKKKIPPSLPPLRPTGVALGGGGCENKKVNSQNNTAIDLKFCMHNPVLTLFQEKNPPCLRATSGMAQPPLKR